MPLNHSECRQIIEGIFCRPDLPEELRTRFSQWMVDHENDPMLRQVMLEMWDSIPNNPAEISAKALHRLLADIEALEGTGGKPKLRTRFKKYFKAAAIISAIFAAGFATSILLKGKAHIEEPTTILLTAPGSTGHYRLPDGTEVWLNSESRLCYTGNLDGPVRQVSLKGEAYFEVAKNIARPFHVIMDSMQVEVTGTAFDAINYEFDSEQVALQRGSVNVRNKVNDTTVALRPNQIITRMRGKSDLSVDSIESANYCGWMARSIILDNRPLADVITILERRYAVNISVDSRIKTSKRLSFTIAGETFDETATLLERLIPVKFERNGNIVNLTTP